MKSRSPRGELVVVGSLLAAGACAVAFVLLYIFDSHNTQLLGLSLGLALVFLAVASVVAGRKVVDQRKGGLNVAAGIGATRFFLFALALFLLRQRDPDRCEAKSRDYDRH